MKATINGHDYEVDNVSIQTTGKKVVLSRYDELEATEPFPDLSELLPLTDVESVAVYDDNGQEIDFGLNFNKVDSVASFFCSPRSYTYTITLKEV